jgi:hypothetical protein
MQDTEPSSLEHEDQVTGPSNNSNSVGTVLQGRVVQSTAVTASTAKVPRVRPDGVAKQEAPAFVPPAPMDLVDDDEGDDEASAHAAGLGAMDFGDLAVPGGGSAAASDARAAAVAEKMQEAGEVRDFWRNEGVLTSLWKVPPPPPLLSAALLCSKVHGFAPQTHQST